MADKRVFLQTKSKPFAPISQLLTQRLLLAYSIVLILIGLVASPPQALWQGSLAILNAPSNLISDYFAIGNLGSAFLNSGLLTLISILLAKKQGTIISGPMIAAFFTISGFSFFGKNIFNSIPIPLGVYLYSYIQQRPATQYSLVALFGSAASPVISYLAFGLGLPLPVGIAFGYGVGLLIGLALPPLAAQFLQFHQGFSLYNIGFAAGIITMFFTSFLRLFDLEVYSNKQLTTEYHYYLAAFLLILCLAMFLIGYLLNQRSLKGLPELFQTSGKLMTDYVTIFSLGVTMMNMAMMGMLMLFFVFFLQGELSGPLLGAILTVIGFSAFGNHWRNSLPVMVGVVLATKVGLTSDVSTFSLLLTAIFGTSLAPISGYYGPVAGVIAGVVHAALVTNITYLHGGLNLYNNGFSSGFVAAAMVPLLDEYQQIRRRRRK